MFAEIVCAVWLATTLIWYRLVAGSFSPFAAVALWKDACINADIRNRTQNLAKQMGRVLRSPEFKASVQRGINSSRTLRACLLRLTDEVAAVAKEDGSYPVSLAGAEVQRYRREILDPTPDQGQDSGS